MSAEPHFPIIIGGGSTLNNGHQFLGQGIYSISEAAALSGVAPAKISRWIRGYSRTSATGPLREPAVFAQQFPQIKGKSALSFLDLIEVQFVDWFRRQGVSWKSIRIAARRAAELLNSTHPFAKRDFYTDGRTILARISEGVEEPDLLDLVRQQYEIDRIVSPILHGRLDFDETDLARRWWPLGRERGVLIDPRLSFGQPIVERYGIPTRVLAESYRSAGSERTVADWFEVDIEAVRAALDFEHVVLAA